jgi:hypothetical protein
VNESPLLQGETVTVSVLLTGLALLWALKRLQRSRPDMAVGLPLLTALGIRLLAIVGIAATGLQSSLRGGDETTFMDLARFLANSPFGHGFFPHGRYPLHVVVFALQLKFGDFTDGALRVTQVGISLLGVLLLVAAAHDLAGGRASRRLMWILALEPASIFFNSILHKEPLMLLGTGLVVFGGTKLWQRLDYRGVVIMALGGLIAVETRPYAGWFLVSAGVVVILHASLRRLDAPLKAMPLVYAVVIAGFIAAPAIVQVTSNKSLQTLQQSQDANTSAGASSTGSAANGNNLALDKVNFSTRGAVFSNLPKRMLDVIFRPYPWQVANRSQQLGAIGSLFAMAGLALLIGALWRRRGHIVADVGPILYPLLFLLMAYSLSAGNAGTSFRYRTHLVTLGFAMMMVLRARTEAARAPVTAAVAGPENAAAKTSISATPEWASHAPRGA